MPEPGILRQVESASASMRGLPPRRQLSRLSPKNVIVQPSSGSLGDRHPLPALLGTTVQGAHLLQREQRVPKPMLSEGLSMKTPVASRSPARVTRRNFLGLTGASALGLVLPFAPPVSAEELHPKVVHMIHQRSGEVFSEVYFDGKQLINEALTKFSVFARDMHAEEARDMDAKLLDVVWAMQQELGLDEPLEVTSGYRTPRTNARTAGASKNSFHVQGQALDLKHKAGIAALHAAADGAASGGVGRYRTFVHIDTGPARRW